MDKNNAVRIKNELMIRTIRGFVDGNLREIIDRIPVEMRPRELPAMRCCVYKDRAVLKYRLMALLGFGVEDESDESKTLAAYVDDALTRTAPDENILSVLDVACYGCVQSQYLVTNACRGCFARPCVFNCPKQAIEVRDGQAKIDQRKCIDCGKCTQVCPYHAVIRVPIPCEEACPVNAIRKHPDGKEYIDFEACISCGKCLRACPFGAVLERSQVIDVLREIKAGKKVVAMVAPAVVGQFAGSLEQIAEALQLAGFDHMEEVARGAELTTEHETEEFFERMARGDKLMTSSCCPAYTEAVKRHVPALQPFVSSTPTPMSFIAREVKKENPDYVTVFIGPCVAKRKEALKDGNVDWVMTFEELGALFVALEIDVASLPGVKLTRKVGGHARGFATSCGVTAAILNEAAGQCPDQEVPELDSKFINGLDRKSMKLLQMYGMGKLPGNFLEVMACEGGCVGGPCRLCDVKLATQAVKNLAEQED